MKRGAKLYAIDPRRTASAQWADVWAGLDVGTDIALSNTMAREIIAAGLANREFIDHATTGFEAYRTLVEPWTLRARRGRNRRAGGGHPRDGAHLRHAPSAP